MAYSTRRKSVNLSLLGIHVPRASSQLQQQHQQQLQQHPKEAAPQDESSPPAKKIKRSHSDLSSSPSRQSPSKSAPINPSLAAHTPPPSPPPEGEDADESALPEYPKVDTDGINDDVVVATIKLLEQTDNRPLMLKELAAVLCKQLAVVESSANQSAIISSRLTNYLRRPWTALAPCPLGKELVGTHPKRLFFFLSGRPRGPFPDPDPPAAHRIISPSLTSATDEEEEQQSRRRAEMSPSPELELTPPDLDDDGTVDDLSRSDSFPHIPGTGTSTPGLAHSRTSPPLEKDEHEFTETANSLQLLRRSESMEMKVCLPVIVDQSDQLMVNAEDESEETVQRRNKEAAAVLFGTAENHLGLKKPAFLASSPLLHPAMDLDSFHPKPIPPPLSLSQNNESSFVWTELKSPETVELDELEDLFESY